MSEAMDRPESPEQSSCSDSESDNPGEERLTFGKHAGRRLDELDELDEGYRDWALHPNRANEPWNERWYQDFVDLNRRYEKWLSKRQKQRSPGSTLMWFGKNKGLPFSTVYNDKGYLAFLLNPQHAHMAWYPRLEKLKLRYGEWLHTHRKPFRSRQATGHSRDIGQKTGKWDDKLDAPGPNDDYKHDGFVVSDADDSEEEDEDEVDYATEGDARPDNDGGEWQQARPGEEDTSGEESAQTTSDADSDSSTEGGHYTFLEPRKAILVKHGRELPYTPLLSTPQRTSRRPDRRREDDRDKDETDVEDTPTKASTSGTRVTEITHHPRDVPLEELFTPEGSSDGSSSGESRPRKRKEESDKESDEGQPQRTRRRTGTPASSSAHPEDARARRGRRDTGAR